MIIINTIKIDRPNMPHYIFLTLEGYTFLPGSESPEPDVKNLQVLGFAEGDGPEEAFEALLAENEWIGEGGYEEVVGMEVRGEKW